jgi:hypothetical protein
MMTWATASPATGVVAWDNGERAHVFTDLLPRQHTEAGECDECERQFSPDEGAPIAVPVEPALVGRSDPFSVKFAGLAGEPAQELVDAGEQRQAELIVAGTREPGVRGRLVGASVSQDVAYRARCDVPIVHSGSD